MLKRLRLALECCLLFNLIRLLRIRGQSERVARGTALGLVVHLVPTFGFGVLVSGFVAKLPGGDGVAGVVGGATLSFFWPALFYLNLRTGRLFVQPPVVICGLETGTEKTVKAPALGRHWVPSDFSLPRFMRL